MMKCKTCQRDFYTEYSFRDHMRNSHSHLVSHIEDDDNSFSVSPFITASLVADSVDLFGGVGVQQDSTPSFGGFGGGDSGGAGASDSWTDTSNNS